MALGLISVNCSKNDDAPKCVSCTSELGNEFEICNIGNDIFKFTEFGVIWTLDKGDLKGQTPQEFVQEACDDDDGCESCISNLENEYEICDNGDGTYLITINGEESHTFSEAELEGYAPDELLYFLCSDAPELKF